MQLIACCKPYKLFGLRKTLLILKLSIIFLFAFCLNVSANGFSQPQITVQGKVTGENGEPLSGATVTEKGINNAVTTRQDGSFSITVSGERSILVISFVGYEEQEFRVGNQNSITVQLQQRSNALADVVVIGYGTARKKDLTGAVSTISEKDLNPGAVTNPLQQIAGRAPGVNVRQVGSEPGNAPSVRIRGITSLIGGNDPLVVVDGIQGGMDLLNQVPPSEIESVDILKDASATAIYGSRGAPGVILITTKKGRSGKTTLEYNVTASVDVITKKLDMLNASEWTEQAQKWNLPASTNKGGNTDWFDLLTRTGSTQNHTLSFGGGSNGFSYRASLSAILQNGLVINSNFKNYIGRIQATQKAFDNKLTLTFNLNSGASSTLSSPGSVGTAAFTSNLISLTYVTRPTDPIYAPDGSYFTDPGVFQYINPYAVAQTVVNESNSNNLFGSLRADLQLLPGLTAGWFGSWRKRDSKSGYYLPALSTVTAAIDNKGIANINNNGQNERLMDITLNYKKGFSNHNLEGLIGYEWQNQTYQGNFSQAKGFFSDITTYDALQLGDLSRVQPGDFSSYKNDRTLVSFFGRVNYSFLNRYLLTATLRRDGSSVFGPNQKWGNFPSASIAWKIVDEPFMRRQQVFNDLKLRVGYGVTGNQQGLSPQRSLELVGGSGVAYFGGAVVTNYAVTQNANRDLTWETRNQANAGVDFSLLNSRLNGSVDVFRATTKNLLFNYSVPRPPFPFGTITANVGSLLNEGLELALNYQVIKSKNTNLILGGNLSLLKNEVLNLSGSINGVPLNTDTVGWGTNAYLIKGEPIGLFNILKYEGKNAQNVMTVVDRDKNNTIDQGARSKDRFVEGSALPTYTYAFTPSFSHKNLDISMVWRGSGGNKIYNSVRASLSAFENLGKSNLLRSAVPLGIFTNRYASDLWLENGSFLRFENFTVGYRINTQSLKYINGLRLSLTANNIALFTKYSGLDPEVSANGGSGSGTDNGTYPRTTGIAVGLNVVFK
jgi:TonB-dependent starch-binding outer membrane protein SusC